MSYDEYVHHIAQKYRLAVAISVIKTKPDNLSIDEYLLELQNKIKNTEIDPNETVCSDDFNFDATPYENKQSNTQKDRTICDTANGIGLDYLGNENEGSQTILNDFVFGNDLESNIKVRRESELEDTIKSLKEVTMDILENHNVNQNLSQITFCESQESIVNTDNNITYCTSTITNPVNVIEINSTQNQNGNDNNTDSQETQLYTLHGFTQNYTHISQTQGEYVVIPDKYIRNKANNGNNIHDHLQDGNKYNGDKTEMIYNVNQNVLTQNEFAFANKEARNSIYDANVENNFSSTQFQSQDVTKKVAMNIYTAGKGDDNIEVTQNVVKYVENASLAQTFEFNIHNIDEFTDNSKGATIARHKVVCKDKRLNLNGTNENADSNNDTSFLSFNGQNTPKTSNVNIKMDNNDIRHKNNSIQYSQEILEPDNSMNNNEKSTNIQESTEVESEHEMEVDESDSDEILQERVPFKVLEELNRVKSFLNRRDRRNDGGYSTDSGYRSDSKTRSLISSSQLSGTWLNQSAHCLFNHILQTSGTDDIVKEIAQVLGQLIDKLHEEENYPPFLEELFESVDQMVKETHEGGGWSDNVLITKDEHIQRLILLNKSKYILQYTIEKITTILQELHTNLTQENLYELSNIVEVENVCYIFHILEIFLKRYMKVKDTSSQSTQNSQEDSFPKRSSLTELWRKKWNPNSKEVINNENKTCVLKTCSEILNKIIVECMEGYSLIAFAALQCFNLIQCLNKNYETVINVLFANTKMAESGRKRCRKSKLVPRDCADFFEEDAVLQAHSQQRGGANWPRLKELEERRINNNGKSF